MSLVEDLLDLPLLGFNVFSIFVSKYAHLPTLSGHFALAYTAFQW
jgi:hypothetical protein